MRVARSKWAKPLSTKSVLMGAYSSSEMSHFEEALAVSRPLQRLLFQPTLIAPLF